MNVSYDGQLAIAAEEACVLQPYDDRGTPAWGFGHQDETLKTGSGQKTTLAAAWAMLADDAAIAGRGVANYVTAPLRQNEYDALVSLAFNFGVTGFRATGIPDLLNAGKREEAIALWHSITKNEGRRDREADLFETGVYPPARNRIKLSETGGGIFSWKFVDPPPRPVTAAGVPVPLASPIAAPAKGGYVLSWLADVLRAAGLKVVEQPGWRTRGHGDVGNIVGVLCHHTAGGLTGNAPSLGVVTNGRPGLSGPLAQLVLGRDGTFYVVAAGKCYHAGPGRWQGVTDGNGRLIGIEAENTGLPNDSPWPAVQVNAYTRGVAAILTHIGGPAIMCAGHKEFALPAGRKSDPDFDLVSFRAVVAHLLGAPGPVPVPIVTPPSPAPTGKVKVVGVKPDTLTLRAQPSAKAKSLGQIPEGTILTKLSASGTWSQIVTPAGYRGWSASRFIVAA